MADLLLDAVAPQGVPGFAQYRLPGRPSSSGLTSDGLERYARTFLLAAFRIAGAGGDVPASLIERYAEGPASGERLRAFLEQYQHMFARDGAPVYQGRSLCYRFASVAPLWRGELTDGSPLPAGRTRRIASGVLRHFVEHGALDDRGLLDLGWYERFLSGTQTYSGPTSPYWASKAFLGLLLPADHPVWTEPESPAPIDDGDRAVAMPGPGWLLQATRHDGLVRLVNHGSDRARHLPADGLDDQVNQTAWPASRSPCTVSATPPPRRPLTPTRSACASPRRTWWRPATPAEVPSTSRSSRSPVIASIPSCRKHRSLPRLTETVSRFSSRTENGWKSASVPEYLRTSPGGRRARALAGG